MKRLFSMLLAAALLLSLLPVSPASAATCSGNIGSLKWKLDTSTGKLTISGSGAMPNYENAYSYGWYKYESDIKSVNVESGVTSIGDYAFYCYPNISKLSLSNTVTTMGQYAFYNCDALTTTYNTGYLQSIGACAFYGCDGLTSVILSGQTTQMGQAVYAACKNLASVTVGNGACIGASAFADCGKLSSLQFSRDVPVIGSAAFEDCDSLTSVILPEGLKALHSAAFDNCDKLSSVTLPEGLETLGSFAFRNCGALSSVLIPDNVTEIGQNPFAGCDSLTGIYFTGSGVHYQSIKGVLYNRDGTELLAYPCGNTDSFFTVPDTVTSIAPYAFYNCVGLSGVTIPSDLTTVGKNSFEDCTNLRSINHSGVDRTISVKTIEEYAFSGCTALLDLTIVGAEYIGKNAFESCKTLFTLRVKGRPRIEKEAFLNCYDLTSLELGDTYEIGDRAFYDTGLSAYTLPASVRFVGKDAFANCLETRSITVLNPGCRFYGWESSETFSGLAGKKITFHGYENSSVKAYADRYGHSFTAHTFDENGKCTRCNYSQYSYDDGDWRFTAADGAAYLYGFGETVPTYHYDGPQSWQDFNYAITHLVMGNDVKTISDSAFKGQTAMESLNLVNVEEIGAGAFSGCTSLERLYLPDTMRTLGEQAFSGCTSLISAVLRPNVESVDYNAFYGCSSLLEVDVLNPNCYISDYKCTLGDPAITTIFGFIPSTAYSYATKYGYEFVELNGCEYGYHKYEVVSCVEADCENSGEVVYMCSGCEEGYAETIEALGHNMVPNESLPSCTDEGYTEYACSRCAYSYRSDFLPATGHSYTAHEVTPTCTGQGYTEYFCSACGDSYKADYTEPTGHNYIPETYHATCTEDGYTRWVCHGCGDSYTSDYIPATGHTYRPMTVSPTCTEGGFTEYRCEGCGDSYKADYTEPTGHNYMVVTFPATCLEWGYTEFSCEGCGDRYVESYIEPKGHRYDSTTIQPTCTEQGYTEHRCVCGDFFVDSYTAPEGHMFIDGVCRDCGAADPGYNAPTTAFSDVSAGAWYKGAVDYAVTHGLMNGTGIGKFEPDSPMTRAMLVTVLWRYEGQPEGYTNQFTDVPNGKWYAKAVAWASNNGIVNGVGNGRFDPDGRITREQMAAILFRYSQAKGIGTDKRANLDAYPDGGKTSGYAGDALRWAIAEGLITGSRAGSTVYLDPQGNATRAQVATILMRYLENVA